MPSWLRRRCPAIDYYPRRNKRRTLRSYSRYKYSRRISRRGRRRSRKNYQKTRIHKFKLRFAGHWPSWSANEIKTFVPVLYMKDTSFDEKTSSEFYRIEALKLHFIPKYWAEQPENMNDRDAVAQLWIRRIFNGVVPNNYPGKDIKADEFEDSEMVYLSGVKTFYTSKFGGTAFVPSETIAANPTRDATKTVRTSFSNKRWYTSGDELDFKPFMLTLTNKVTDDYDYYWTSWIHCKNFVLKHDEPALHPMQMFDIKLVGLKDLANFSLNRCKSDPQTLNKD